MILFPALYGQRYAAPTHHPNITSIWLKPLSDICGIIGLVRTLMPPFTKCTILCFDKCVYGEGEQYKCYWGDIITIKCSRKSTNLYFS